MVIDYHTHLDDGGAADKLLQSTDDAEIDASIVIAKTLPAGISNDRSGPGNSQALREAVDNHKLRFLKNR